LTRYGIEADVEWNGEMTVAVDPGHLDHLKGDYELHVPTGMMSCARQQRRTRTTRFAAFRGRDVVAQSQRHDSSGESSRGA
jgi:hypothetical protein